MKTLSRKPTIGDRIMSEKIKKFLKEEEGTVVLGFGVVIGLIAGVASLGIILGFAVWGANTYQTLSTHFGY
jgi:Flp pilus assembly pilin Flp